MLITKISDFKPYKKYIIYDTFSNHIMTYRQMQKIMTEKEIQKLIDNGKVSELK